MRAVKGDVRRNKASHNAGKGVLVLVELIVDFTNPAEACGHHEVGGQAVVVSQKEAATQGRLELLAIQWVWCYHKISGGVAAIEAVVAEAVPPLAVVETLRRS